MDTLRPGDPIFSAQRKEGLIRGGGEKGSRGRRTWLTLCNSRRLSRSYIKDKSASKSGIFFLMKTQNDICTFEMNKQEVIFVGTKRLN